jgi:hypothetical protein
VLLVGLLGTVVFGTQFGAEYGGVIWGNQSIWWTPQELAVPLSATTNEFELYINGELLQKQLERGSLTTADTTGTTHQVVTDDIKVRLNNWHTIKASKLHSVVFTAFALGMSLSCLALGLVWRYGKS